MTYPSETALRTVTDILLANLDFTGDSMARVQAAYGLALRIAHILRRTPDHIADEGGEALPVEQRLETIIDAAIDVSPRVTGREVYVPLALLYAAVALIHNLRKDIVEADGRICPLALSDPHGACVLSVESELRADAAERDATALHAVLFEMFREGPVDVAMAGNPAAIESLKERTFAALDAYEARIQREHEGDA